MATKINNNLNRKIKKSVVNDPGEVKSGLEMAFLQEGSLLVSGQTDPNALAMPPELEFEHERLNFIYGENDVKRADG